MKKILAILMSAMVALSMFPMMSFAAEGDSDSPDASQTQSDTGNTYTVADYNNAQKALAQAKANQQNGPILFLDSLVSDSSYSVENQLKNAAKSSDSVIKASYKKYGSKWASQFTYSNLKRQATLLNELNKRRASDNNFTDDANRSALKLDPDLVVTAMVSAMISSNKVAHVLFMTSDDSIINLGEGENLSWGYSNPLKGWYDEEKVNYDKKNGDETGHYENCMEAWNAYGTGVVGFGMTNFGLYGGCDSLRFSSSYEGKAYTADEWLSAISSFQSTLKANVQTAESNLATITKAFEENGQLISKVTLSASKYTYDGKVKKPSVKVYNNKGEQLQSGYTVSVPSGKNLGAYTVKVTGTGDYVGTVSATYMITPAKMAKPTVKAAKKKVTIKWKKLGGGSQTYQIALKKKGGKWKYYTSTGSSKTIKKLTSKKKYTVKIRSYKKISGSNRYGSWSSSKTVKVK